MKRQIIQIDEEKCTGCGLCIPNCHEGALQIIDDKARLISDLFCDGLGACIGHCPEGAIEMIEREAEPYDEVRVIAEIAKKGKNTIQAHLNHLEEHGEIGFYGEAVAYLKANNIEFETKESKNQIVMEELHPHPHHHGGGCPGSAAKSLGPKNEELNIVAGDQPSRLTQWPVQMHLINPSAGYFQSADVLLAADCVAFSLGSFHEKYLKGRKLLIACPKLDSNQDVYVEKLRRLIDESKINTLSVMIMEVPCCGGLLQMTQKAVSMATRKVPVKLTVVGIQGDILEEEWV
jgi:ferredoxin